MKNQYFRVFRNARLGHAGSPQGWENGQKKTFFQKSWKCISQMKKEIIRDESAVKNCIITAISKCYLLKSTIKIPKCQFFGARYTVAAVPAKPPPMLGKVQNCSNKNTFSEIIKNTHNGQTVLRDRSVSKLWVKTHIVVTSSTKNLDFFEIIAAECCLLL